MLSCLLYFLFFFFNDTATTEIYTLSLHDALPISQQESNDNHYPRTAPASNRSCQRERRQHKRKHHRDRLRGDHAAVPVVVVADISAKRREKQHEIGRASCRERV